MRFNVLVAGFLAFAAVAACTSEDEGPFGPRLDREQVAGVYNLTTLTFDPRGSLPAKDVLGLLPPADRPQLVVGRTDDTFQIAFRDPVTGLIEPLAGTYELREKGIRLNFATLQDAQRLLFPQQIDLAFAEEAVTLSDERNQSVPLPRLRELVPEFAEEPLANPVPGRLMVLFTLDRR